MSAATARPPVFAWALGLFLAGALAASCATPLPEAGSEDASLYQTRCGRCHPAYQPHLLTAEMWKVTIDRMESRNMKRLGIELDPAERERILAYLGRHAGGK